MSNKNKIEPVMILETSKKRQSPIENNMLSNNNKNNIE